MATNINPIIPFAIGATIGAAVATILTSDKNTPVRDKLRDVALAVLDTAEEALEKGGQR